MYFTPRLPLGTHLPPHHSAEAQLKARIGVEFANGTGVEFERRADTTSSGEVDTSLDKYAGADFKGEGGIGVSSNGGAELGRDAAVELEHSVFGGDSPLSSPPSSRPPSPAMNARKRRDKERSRARRADKRREERAQNIDATRIPGARAKESHVDTAQKLPSKFNVKKNIPSASTGYVATQEKAGGASTLQQLLEKGFELVKWDGR